MEGRGARKVLSISHHHNHRFCRNVALICHKISNQSGKCLTFSSHGRVDKPIKQCGVVGRTRTPAREITMGLLLLEGSLRWGRRRNERGRWIPKSIRYLRTRARAEGGQATKFASWLRLLSPCLFVRCRGRKHKPKYMVPFFHSLAHFAEKPHGSSLGRRCSLRSRTDSVGKRPTFTTLLESPVERPTSNTPRTPSSTQITSP